MINEFSSKEEVLAAVAQWGPALQYASEDLKKDREVVLAAVAQSGWALQYASEDLKKDRDVVLAAVAQWGWALEYASEDLKKNRDFVLAAVAKWGAALEYASEDLKKDREVVLAAVAQSGWALQYASEDLKKDRDVVLAAIAQLGLALEYASEDLKKDREVVLAAVAQWGLALQYASEDLKKNSLLQQVSRLGVDSSPAFLALLPLKEKLAQETDLEKKEAAKIMITTIEEAIVSCYKNRNYQLFAEAFNQAVATARPVLEKQPIWMQAIDYVANLLMRVLQAAFPQQNQENSGKRLSFFPRPDLLDKATKAAAEELLSQFNKLDP